VSEPARVTAGTGPPLAIRARHPARLEPPSSLVHPCATPVQRPPRSMNHMSNSMDHLSASIDHLPPSMNHLSPSTNHLSPSTNRLSPSMNHLSPSIDHLSTSMNHLSDPPHRRAGSLKRWSPLDLFLSHRSTGGRMQGTANSLVRLRLYRARHADHAL